MKTVAWVLCAVLLSSCFGLSSDITIKKDGSGSIAVEYRISEDLINLGSLDGNAGLPSLPVGEEDFKRTVERIDGLSLKKFSSKKVGEDYLYHVILDFKNISSLIQFLDTQGQHCSISESGGKQVLRIVFSRGSEEYSQEMHELIPMLFAGYDFNFKISLYKNCEVSFFDSEANTLRKPPFGSIKANADTVAFTSPMGDLFSSPETAAMEIRW